MKKRASGVVNTYLEIKVKANARLYLFLLLSARTNRNAATTSTEGFVSLLFVGEGGCLE